MKYNYHVGIIMHSDHNKIKYVTKIDKQNKCAHWTAGEPAMKFSKTVADDYVYGLVVNGFMAMTVKVPEFYCLQNGEDINDEQ